MTDESKRHTPYHNSENCVPLGQPFSPGIDPTLFGKSGVDIRLAGWLRKSGRKKIAHAYLRGVDRRAETRCSGAAPDIN